MTPGKLNAIVMLTVVLLISIALDRQAQAENGFNQGDLHMMHREMTAIKQQGLIELTAVLGQEKFQILRTEILTTYPMDFRELPEEEKFSHLRHWLEINDEDARQVAAILQQSLEQRQDVMQRAGLSLEQKIGLRRQMVEQHGQFQSPFMGMGSL